MRRKFKMSYATGITPARFMSAIKKCQKYAPVDEVTLKRWYESDCMADVLDEICERIEKNVGEELWKKIEI